jgi:hypothetical protein
VVYLTEAGCVEFNRKVSIDPAHEIVGGLDSVEWEKVRSHLDVGIKGLFAGGEVFRIL